MTLCIAVIGTSDQSCWLAEACKILILLLLHSVALFVAQRQQSCIIRYLACKAQLQYGYED